MGEFNTKNRILGRGRLYLHLYREWIEEDVSPENPYSHVLNSSELNLPIERFYLENNRDINKPRII